MTIQHIKTHEIEGVLHVVTGLHVGAGRDAVEIGGVDSPVIKHPHTQQPYIPGSSIKGKLRSLLEWTLHKVQDDGMPWGSDKRVPAGPDDEILRIFGTTRDDWEAGPTRVVVRDAHLVKEWLDRVISDGLPMTEDKSEVAIDRIQGKAASMGPRTMERVPAGAQFRLEILFKEYAVEGDGGERDKACLNRLLEALKLLEKDCLGGSGSRGYGQVRIQGLRIDGRDIQERFDGIQSISKDRAQDLLS